MEKWIQNIIDEKKNLLDVLVEVKYFEKVEKAGSLLLAALKKGNKILLAGNGGSAADAQHFAGEIVGRFTMERPSLPALSLCVDPSVTTCIGNDYGYDNVFARQVAGLGNAGDVFIAISTSGNSANIIQAIAMARKKQMLVIGYMGKDGGKMQSLCDISLVVPSNSTPRIQEIHTLTTHILCEMIEKGMFA
ncbi:D-sedoheptulose 7-phosphate isomerase [Megasphaera sp.]|uniref:D-sedoheptulose 7-phosphate isomerase n=1 Tax=Megasphaera sp. TaxID=2023260 RepID=UPI00352052C9